MLGRVKVEDATCSALPLSGFLALLREAGRQAPAWPGKTRQERRAQGFRSPVAVYSGDVSSSCP